MSKTIEGLEAARQIYQRKIDRTTGRERGNFTTTVGAGTLEYLKNIHPNAGRLIDTLITLYRVEFNHTTPEQVREFIDSNLG